MFRSQYGEGMQAQFYDLHGIRVLECAAQGPQLRNAQDTMALIEEALAHAALLIVIPAARLDPDFFQLRTWLAGEMLQKIVTYRRRLAIIGDFAEMASHSEALRAFIYESNRGNHVWFLADIGEVRDRLAARERSS